MLRVIITHRSCAHTLTLLYLLSHFFPYSFLTPPSIPPSRFFSYFFPYCVHSSLHQSCTHCCSLSFPFLLTLLLPSLFSIQITHLHFNTPPPPDSFASSLSFPPCASIPPSWKATDQGRNGLITVWCAFAWLHATELSSVRLLINDLCFYWYMSDTSKESDSPIKAQCVAGSSAWVCECGGANDLRCSVLSQQTDIWVMKSWWSFWNKSSTWYRAMLP